MSMVLKVTFLVAAGLVGALVSKLSAAGAESVNETEATAILSSALRLLDVPEPLSKVRVTSFGREPSSELWIVKLRSANGDVFTGYLRKTDGHLEQISSSREASRIRGNGRTGALYFRDAEYAQDYCRNRLKRIYPSYSLEVTDFKLSGDQVVGGIFTAGKAKLVFRRVKAGYPFIFPSSQGEISFDSQDGGLLGFSGAGRVPPTAAIPQVILSRNSACTKAFGRIIAPSAMDGELCGWAVPEGGDQAILAWVFHAKRETVGVRADNGSVMFRWPKK